MNFAFTSRAVLVALALSVASPSCHNAYALLWDDFESYDLGVWPGPNWVALANAVGDPANNHVALDPDALSPNNKVLGLHGVVNTSASALHAFDNPSNFVIESRVWNGDEDQPAGWGRGSISITKDIAFVPSRTLFQFWPDGTWTTEGGLSGSYDTKRWYDVKVQYNRQGSDLDLSYWLDGIFVGDANVTVADVSTEAMFGYVNLNAGGTAYFDDIHVRAVPEPEPAVLMLVGIFTALGVMCRRRE
ncbi:MAG: hypothetical protein WD971_09345 [Pirellulales bacterium]